MTEPLTPNQVAARLDRLPVGRFHYRFLALIALGAWFDYYDNFVAGTLAVVLPQAGVLPEAQPGAWVSVLGMFMAALPLGMFLGSMFLGLASDYLGRRFGFIAMLLLYSLASLGAGAGYYPLVAVAGSSAGLVLLLGTRFLAGAGVGAENVIIDTYVSEMVPRQIRGWAIAWTQAVAFTALPVAALLGRLLTPKESPSNWWLLLVIGSLGALLSWNFRRNLPESPRWSALVGRHEQAQAALQAIEQAVESELGAALPPVSMPAQPAARRAPFHAIWSPRYRGRTVLLVVFQVLQIIGYYGFVHWLATMLLAKQYGANAALSMQLAASLLAPAGPLLAVWTCERLERKWLIVILALGISTAQMLFGVVQQALLLTVTAAVVIVCLNWFSAVFHAYQAELYPTEARATGVGFTYAWSRASMAGLSLFMPGLIATSLPLAIGLLAASMLGVALLVGVFGPLTNARSLEDLSPS
jgi:putative MFS transporter